MSPRRGAWCFLIQGRVVSCVSLIVDTSKCTLWREMLSDMKNIETETKKMLGLNAPYGARCFLTPPRKDRL